MTKQILHHLFLLVNTSLGIRKVYGMLGRVKSKHAKSHSY